MELSLKMESFIASALIVTLLILACGSAVTAGPNFTINGQPSNVTALEGETVQFHCHFSGFADNTIGMHSMHWEILIGGQRGGFVTDRTFTTHPKGRHGVMTTNTLNNSTLTIRNVSKADPEGYRCLLYQKVIKLTSTWGYLSVLSKPELRQMPSGKIVNKGQNVTLRCHLENVDMSNFFVRWFRNGELISRNYDIILNGTSGVYKEIAVRGNDGSGKFDLTMINIKVNGNFYCDVYLIDPNRVVLKSSIARVDFRGSPAVTTITSRITHDTTSSISVNTDRLKRRILIASLVASIVVVDIGITTFVAHKLFLWKGRQEAANQSGDIGEPPQSQRIDSSQGDVEYQEMQDVENVKDEEGNSIALSAAVTTEPTISQPYENIAKTEHDVTHAKVCKQKPSTETKPDGDDIMASTLNESCHNENDDEMKKFRNVEGLVYADLDIQHNGDRSHTVNLPSIYDDEVTVTYVELQVYNAKKDKTHLTQFTARQNTVLCLWNSCRLLRNEAKRN